MTCCSCTGLIANFFKLIGTVAKIYLAIPLLGGTNKLYDFLITQNKGEEYYNKAVEVIKTYTMAAPAPAEKEARKLAKKAANDEVKEIKRNNEKYRKEYMRLERSFNRYYAGK